ncbi:hypothetical protein [Brevundimonas mediterranea]|uniref:ABC-type Na+ efflux pump permease subunit n=1 Tax=Brevundimonas mediterranea TaxID=74329 RepID=A0A7W6A317_9CAUL|nr:hypothetical protein [Brevundimonas mediterranea]MBB3871277.1 ABC-type Na+ efflux pump permease subunit [Brevundimonas mediterranea]
MIAVMLISVALIAGLCVLAYTLAVYALPFMLGGEAARLAYATGSGLIGAGLVGLVAGAAAYGLLVFAFASLRSPVLRLIVALVFAAPAAMAGYALVHGVTGDAVPSEVWRQIFCAIGGAVVGVLALVRLVRKIPYQS